MQYYLDAKTLDNKSVEIFKDFISYYSSISYEEIEEMHKRQ